MVQSIYSSNAGLTVRVERHARGVVAREQGLHKAQGEGRTYERNSGAPRICVSTCMFVKASPLGFSANSCTNHTTNEKGREGGY